MKCPVGKFSLEGSAGCTDCPAGTFNNLEGQSVCTPCGPGARSSAGSSVCTICPQGQTNSEDRTSCVPCPAGQFGSSPGTCTRCSTGTFSGTAGATECTTCGTNTFSGEGSAICCSATGYSNPGTTSCTFCNPTSTGTNRFVNTERTACIFCDPKVNPFVYRSVAPGRAPGYSCVKTCANGVTPNEMYGGVRICNR